MGPYDTEPCEVQQFSYDYFSEIAMSFASMALLSMKNQMQQIPNRK